MLADATSPMLPAWLVLPAAAATMLVIAAHILVLPSVPMPASRRRIRMANGFVMLLVAALLAYAFGMTTTDRPRLFVLVWLAIIVLLGIVIGLAGVDVLNTVRMNVSDRRAMRGRLREEELGAGDDAGG